jgi:ParB/RepB/Spo0J family partition protein
MQQALPVNSVEDARLWVLRAYGEYVKGSVGSEITLDYRKVKTYIERHPKDFPISIPDYGDGRIIGMVLGEMADAHVIEPIPGKEVRANGGVLYQVMRARPHIPRPGELMVDLTSLLKPDIEVRSPNTKELIAMMGSIMRHGLQYPLLCRKRADGRIQIVDGLRRYTAFQSLGLMPKVPCIVKDNMDDKTAYELSGMANFEHKMMTPLEEARYFDRYIKNGWGTIETTAKVFSKSEFMIRERLAILTLPQSWQEKVEDAAKHVDDAFRLKMADEAAEYLSTFPDKKEKEKAKVEVEKLMDFYKNRDVPASQVEPCLKTMSEKGVGAAQAIRIVQETESYIQTVRAEGQMTLVQFQSEPRQEFHCPCGRGMEVDWDRKIIFTNPTILPPSDQLRAMSA